MELVLVGLVVIFIWESMDGDMVKGLSLVW